MFEDLRGYLQLATGLSEVTAAKAKEAAMALVSHGLNFTTKAPDVVGQVQELADDLLTTSRSNREALTSLIRAEVDRAVGRMGFVREDELAALRRHVERLDLQVRDLAGATPAPADPIDVASATPGWETEVDTAAPAQAPASPGWSSDGPSAASAPSHSATDSSPAPSSTPSDGIPRKKKKVVVEDESGSNE